MPNYILLPNGEKASSLETMTYNMNRRDQRKGA